MAHEISTPTRRSLVTQGGMLALLGSTASVSAAEADAALVALGKRLEDAWRAEKIATDDPDVSDDELGKLIEATSSIVHDIEKHEAKTIRGLAVKGRACLWCHSGDPIEINTFGSTTDTRLAASVIRDLPTIAGKPALTS